MVRFVLRARLQNFQRFEDTEELELQDLSVFFGPNNAGKSAVLRAIRRMASVDIARHPHIPLPGAVSVLGGDSGLQLQTGDRREGSEAASISLTMSEHVRWPGWEDDDVKWPHEVTATFPKSKENAWLPALSASSVDQLDKSDIPVLRALESLPIVVLPERRELRAPVSYEFPSRPGIREEIVDANLLAPTLLQWHFEQPEKVRELTSRASRIYGAAIEVELRPTSSALLVSVEGEPFRSIEDVGCGVSEVLVLSLALTKYPRGLLLYEEPEQHLHPRVQRRILDELTACAVDTWQVIATTHSNHFMENLFNERVAQFSIEPGENRSNVVCVSRDRERLLSVLHILGARPSSLLQANAVIWVEGPSDAEYLRFWIDQAVGPQLQEFVDYSFAFFGGSLLRHTSFTVAPVPQLIDLLSVHSGAYVFLDSDRTGDYEDLGKEYAKDFVEASQFKDRVWVTKGREVENYLRDEVLLWATAAPARRSDAATALGGSGIDRAFSPLQEQVSALKKAMNLGRAAHDASDANKASFAREAVEMMRSEDSVNWLDCLDLNQQIEALRKFILRCRGDAVA